MRILDLTDVVCPWTIIKTKQTISQLSTGEGLLIMVNDHSFSIDLHVYLKHTKHKLRSIWKQGNSDCYLVEK